MNEGASRVRAFLRDPVVLAVLLGNGAVYCLYRFPILPPEMNAFVLDQLSLIPIAALGILAPWAGLPAPETRRERVFWMFWSGAFGVLLLVRFLYLWGYWAEGLAPWSLAWDLLYGLFYLLLALAVVGRPDRREGIQATVGFTLLEAAGIAAFFLGLIVYFVFVAWGNGPTQYRSWVPSLLFYWVGDVFLFLALLHLRRTSTSPRWRILYSWMAAAPLFWSITEILELRYYLGDEPTGWYTSASVNMLWYLPFAVATLAPRMRLDPFPRALGRGGPQTDDWELRRSLGLPAFLVMAALILPLVHFGANLLGLLDPATRDVRELVVVISTASLLGLVLLHQNLLERKALALARRSRELEDHRRWLAVAVEQSPDAVCIADGEGIVRYANPASTPRGGGPENLVGNELTELIPPELWVDGRLARALEEGLPWDGRFSSEGPDGEAVEEIISLSPSRDPAGKVFQWVLGRNDVTYLSKLERQLGQAQKMEALGTLAGGIAHDFNNILGAIYGYGELLSLEMDPDSPSREDLRGLLTAAERAAELVSQILTFSRQGEEEKKPLLVEPIIREALSMLRATLPSTIQIQEEIHGGEAAILGVRHQIHQMILNLGTNASHAMGEKGGVLRVGLEKALLNDEEAGERGLTAGGEYVLLSVQDTGQGMDASVMRRIYDPFFTTKEVGKGTGLGLSVVHGAVKSHGGGISVASEPGKGTRFEIALPCASPKEGDLEESEAPLPRGTGERVLVVDDEPMLATLADQMLKGLGYEVRSFTSSQEAWAHFRDDPQAFDLLLTDQTMPGITGLELARKVMASRPGFPVLLSTGYSETLSPERLAGAGVGKVLMKPYNRRDLAFAISEILMRAGPWAL